MVTCRDCRSFENECPLLKMREPYSTYPKRVCKFFLDKKERIVRLNVARRTVPTSETIIIIPRDMPRGDIFDWIRSKCQLSDKDIISISATLTEPDGSEYQSVGDRDWILVKRELN